MKIMIDAGHSYDTPGKRSPDGLLEFQINRGIALYAKQLLETYLNVSVYFAHSDTRDVPLKERSDAANKLGVDVYVAIHANASGADWSDARGIETYVHPKKPKEALELAQRVQKHLILDTGLRNRGVKTADFHVLRETHMTAILVECGFMTNREEVKLLRLEDYRKKAAGAIVKGLAEQYRLLKKPAPLQAPPPAPSPSKPKSIEGIYRVQVGAFAEKANADDLVQRLKADGYSAFVEFQPKK